VLRASLLGRNLGGERRRFLEPLNLRARVPSQGVALAIGNGDEVLLNEA